MVSLCITYYLLFAPWDAADKNFAHIIAMFLLFGMALVSIIVEYCFDIYRIIPVDLYGTGLRVVVEDPALLR